MSKPMLRQTPSAMIEPSAVERRRASSGPSMPDRPSARLTRPDVRVEHVPPDDRDRDDARHHGQVVADAEERDAACRSPWFSADRREQPRRDRQRHADDARRRPCCAAAFRNFSSSNSFV